MILLNFFNFNSGACQLKAVTITSQLENSNEWAYKEWQKSVQAVKKWLEAKGETEDLEAKACSKVKYTLPGPMTILDCIVDQFYGEEKFREMVDDLVKIINLEILSLAKHGCKFIQVDEPVLMRYPDKALEYGVKDLAKCFEGMPF